jgi:amidohydrolase
VLPSRTSGPPPGSTPAWIADLADLYDTSSGQWIELRRFLHQHPELSDAEFQTTAHLVSQLEQLDLPTHVSTEGRGATADFSSRRYAEGQPTKKRIAIRGDIDALPIQDSKSVSYRSLCDGVMHACGHDVHAAIMVGTMHLLTALESANKLPWPIAVRAILQPAEELATGARQMIRDHAIRDIDAIIALHVDPTRRVGCVGLRYGTLTAACDSIHVRFEGRGGHGARPHLTHDPIDACTHWVQSAYRRIARTVNPHDTVVFSVGQIVAGHSANVIPEHADIFATLRSLDQASRLTALTTLEDVSEAIARESGCRVDMQLGFSAPAVANDRTMVDLLQSSAAAVLSPGAIEWIDQPSMGSEDFSYYLEQIPGAMFRLGVAGDQVGNEPLHTSAFDIDERAIAIGCKILATAVIQYFAPAPTP